jgi:hypothetical protein
LVALLIPALYVLDKNLEAFYIFQPDQLHDLAKRGIQAHGNDTKSIVRYIVEELSQQVSTQAYVNTREEWVFNNAGGAMGAMYIIHASEFCTSAWRGRAIVQAWLTLVNTGITEYLIIFGRCRPRSAVRCDLGEA